MFHCFDFRSFSLVCFTESGDSTSTEITQDISMETTLVSAMFDTNTSDLPITTQDLIQVHHNK